MMKAQIANPQIAELSELPARMIAIELTLKGAFKKEIEDLDARLAELDEKMGAVENVEEAARLRSAADAYSADAKGKATALLDQAASEAAKAAAKASEVSARESVVAAREKKTDEREAALDSREKSMLDAQKAGLESLASRQAAMDEAEKTMLDRIEKLKGEAADLNARIEAGLARLAGLKV